MGTWKTFWIVIVFAFLGGITGVMVAVPSQSSQTTYQTTDYLLVKVLPKITDQNSLEQSLLNVEIDYYLSSSIEEFLNSKPKGLLDVAAAYQSSSSKIQTRITSDSYSRSVRLSEEFVALVQLNINSAKEIGVKQDHEFYATKNLNSSSSQVEVNNPRLRIVEYGILGALQVGVITWGIIALASSKKPTK